MDGRTTSPGAGLTIGRGGGKRLRYPDMDQADASLWLKKVRRRGRIRVLLGFAGFSVAVYGMTRRMMKISMIGVVESWHHSRVIVGRYYFTSVTMTTVLCIRVASRLELRPELRPELRSELRSEYWSEY